MNARLLLASLAAAATLAAPTLAQPGSSTAPLRATSLHAQAEKTSGRGDIVPLHSADFNHSGTVDVEDIFDYLTGWLAGSPACDTNGNGVLDGFDILEFINLWFAAPSASVSRAS